MINALGVVAVVLVIANICLMIDSLQKGFAGSITATFAFNAMMLAITGGYLFGL